ncbi:alpha/beta fold hydrolase [Pseudoduganella sp. FT26W]|uniref:Alpha/beta fold hydrolase n=1 Tax=Duganella aquatilis TaxID=2666082 RepID=A0A844D9A5_9BURK|nr:alpha/beta hydrolase [Duganella aquatilis]MRW83564.1 alpha/beta fold hydrolase [Duganella aquatilis]
MSALQHRLIAANGIQMHVAEQGGGPAVLFCHGFLETWYAWRHQLPALAGAGFRAIAPDMRGYGQTDRPAGADQYSVWHLVGDMVGLLDALDIERAIIVGNDWGATVAWQAALLRPDRFHAVAAFGVPLMGRAPMPPSQLFPQNEQALFYTLYLQQQDGPQAELERDVRETLGKLLLSASGEGAVNPFSMVARLSGMLAPLPSAALPAWLSEADLQVYVDAYARSGFGGALNYYRNLDRNWELQAALSGMQLAVPALFMAGERDPGLQMPGMSDIIDAMIQLAPGLVRSELVADCGHWIQQEQPALVNAALVAFANSVEAKTIGAK